MQVRATHISIPTPFSLKATALGHGWHECAPMSWCEAGGCLQTVERIGPVPVRVSLTEMSAGRSTVRVNISLEADRISDSDVSLLRDRVRRMLRADLDLSEFYSLAARHPRLKPVPRIGAGRILRSPSMAENIVKAICATNVNWTQAVKMINRIAQVGPCLKHFRSLNAWPTPAEILSAGDDYLNNVVRLGYRTESVTSFCRSVKSGEFDPDELDRAAATETTEELLARLRSIRGVGPATAHFLLGMLGRFDRVSVDSATIAYVARAYMGGKKPTVKQVEAIFEEYGKWRSLVWWFEQWLHWDTARSMLNGHGRRK